VRFLAACKVCTHHTVAVAVGLAGRAWVAGLALAIVAALAIGALAAT
jgi:hypothetical protein